MKKLMFISVLASFAIVMSSFRFFEANNPPQKINKTYSSCTWTTSDGGVSYSPKQLKSMWLWKNDVLEKINLYNDLPHHIGTISFTYDNNRIVRMKEKYKYSCCGINKHTDFIYDGNMLKEARCFTKNKLKTTYKFTNDKDKISKIEIINHVGMDRHDLIHTLTFILPSEICFSISHLDRKMNDSIINGNFVLYFTWDKDVITKISVVEKYGDKQYETTILQEYDHYDNPRFDHFYRGNNVISLCKNNIKRQSWTSSDGKNFVTNYEYNYKEGVPVTCTATTNGRESRITNNNEEKVLEVTTTAVSDYEYQ